MAGEHSDEMEEILHKKLELARSVIKKYVREIEKIMSCPGDVMDLSNRCYLVSAGYLSMGYEEKRLMSVNYKD